MIMCGWKHHHNDMAITEFRHRSCSNLLGGTSLLLFLDHNKQVTVTMHM